MSKLEIAPGLSLPVDFVTSTQAILAKKGSGKSYLASVQAEELLEAGHQVVVLDPTGAWSGLRSSADGKAAGFPIVVLGGDHGDLPLEATAGEVIASAIAADHFSAVLDLTLFRKAEALRFAWGFLETLYRKNRDALHLFIDEADVVAPQRTFGVDDARTLGATEDVVRRGRIRGLGCTLITQRPQVLSKNVLSQVDMLTALRMNHPKDIGAIREWVAVHGDEDQAAKMIASLPSLPIGAAWFWNPASDLFARAQVRRRRTFDSGATPKAGERRVVPKVLAPVDLARLGATIAATVEQAKENDPKSLKAELARLRAELAKKPAAAPASKVETKVVERSVLAPGDLKQLEQLLGQADKVVEGLQGVQARLTMQLAELRTAIIKATAPAARLPVGRAGSVPLPVRITPPAPPRGFRPPSDPGAKGIGGPEQRVLGALAWLVSLGIEQPPIEAVAFLADYRPNGGAFNNTRGRLRSAGLVDYPTPGTMRLTSEGVEAAPFVERPLNDAALHAAVMARLDGPERRLLQPLIDAYPKALSVSDLAAASGYGAGGGAFNNTRGRLRTLGLADYPRPGEVRAADLLFLEGGQ